MMMMKKKNDVLMYKLCLTAGFFDEHGGWDNSFFYFVWELIAKQPGLCGVNECFFDDFFYLNLFYENYVHIFFSVKPFFYFHINLYEFYIT